MMITLLILLRTADVITTYLGITYYGSFVVESNPVVRNILETGGWGLFVLYNFLSVLLIAGILKLLPDKKAFLVTTPMWIFLGLNFVVVLSNLIFLVA